jgi:hypothetical protein
MLDRDETGQDFPELDDVFEPTIEEAILASGLHTAGKVNSPEAGESIEDLADQE